MTAVRRYRRAAGVERAQLRWFAAAAVLLVAALVGMAWLFESGHERAAQLVMATAAPASPIAITVATFRYRLYAIDRLISRAVSYIAITALVGGVYLGAVLVLTSALTDATGSSPSPPPPWRPRASSCTPTPTWAGSPAPS